MYHDTTAKLSPAEPAASSAIDYTHTVLEEARNLVSRVEDLVGRLIGFGPQSANATGLAPSSEPSGALPALRDHAAAVRRRLNEAHAELDRLQGAL